MVLNFSLVCLQFIFGMSITTFIVRKHNLLGAGFYWLVYAIMTILAMLSLISDDTISKIVLIIVAISSLCLLVHSIVYKEAYKEKVSMIFELLVSFNLILLSYSFFLIVDKVAIIDNVYFELLRAMIGALTIGGVTTAMLVGHWYLVQPGLSRKPIEQLCNYAVGVTLITTLLWLVDPSMLDVISGEVSDGWGGTLGYMWIGSSITAIILLIAARMALKEKSYTAVMATTGLLYLAVLMACGLELIPRTILA